MDINKIYNIDCLEGLRMLQDESVNCCVTSPPYFNLRDYGCNGQIGLENTPEEYVSKLVNVFREVKRVLKQNGILWLNIGDCYAGSGKGAWKDKESPKETYVPDSNSPQCKNPKTWKGIKAKNLIGIPWMLAFALRADGWFLRQDIIWHKPNPCPESIKDRCTKSHEYIFLLSKAKKYYFNYKDIMQDAKTNENRPTGVERERINNYNSKSNLHPEAYLKSNCKRNTFPPKPYPTKINKRSVWTVNTHPFKGTHFAVFPEKLIIDCIKAGCPIDGIVLDPFMGAGTTAVVAKKLNRNYIGFELNKEYVELANKRLQKELGLFK